ERMANFQVTSSNHGLEYAREELAQLQKMYRSKDLTEETEEMILKRQRHQVEQAEFLVRTAEVQRDLVVGIELPRQDQSVRAAAVAPRLQPGGVLNPGEVFLTVAAPRPAVVRATVEEKELHLLHPEMKGRAIPTGYPDLKLPARLVRILPVPQAGGTFDARA